MTASPESVFDSFRLKGRVAFISGASGHLGTAMAQALAQAGAHVILNGRDKSRLEQLAHEISDSGASAECHAFDIGDLERARTFFASRERIDIIVNNAVSMTTKLFADISEREFEETYRTAVIAPFEIVRAALPALRNAVAAAGEASVVNIASMYGTVAPDSRIYSHSEQASPIHYGPAKAAVQQLTRHLASVFGREHIRVNCIAPGPFPRRSIATADPAFEARLADRTMLGRLGLPGEIAGPLLFLASPASSFVTGTTLAVDGGWTVW